MKRTLIVISACALLTASLSGCSWFRRGDNVDNFEPIEYSTDIPATTPIISPQPFPQPFQQPVMAPVQSNLANIDRINIQRNPSSPEQLIVEVSGTVPNGCSQVGAVDYRVEGSTFVYKLPLVSNNNGGLCTQALVPFSKRMRLNASGQPLPPGSYNVDVNGNIQPFNI